MAKIVFIMDIEEGHILPSFGLAHSLKNRGHDVSYLSVIDNEPLVKEQGFEFYPLLENTYPKGFREKLKLMSISPAGKIIKGGIDAKARHIEAITNGSYDSFFKDLRADVFVISVFLRIDILLLYYKFNIRPVVITPFLREPNITLTSECLESIQTMPSIERHMLLECLISLNDKFTSLAQIVEPMGEFYELVLCPQEFEMERQTEIANKKYIGPSIRKGKGIRNVHSLYGIPENKKIIYASMGSQAIRHGNICNLFFSKMINVMRCPELQDLHMILSVGQEYERDKLHHLPSNVTVVGWVSQLDILEVSSAAVIHGGLGTVKECIYYGVPMLVFPLNYDQPWNARRVKYHKLGLVDDIRTVSGTDLKSQILYLLNNEEIQSSINRMKTIFREREEAQPGADIIENLIKCTT